MNAVFLHESVFQGDFVEYERHQLRAGFLGHFLKHAIECRGIADAVIGRN